MKKLTTSVLAVVLSSSFAMVSAQTVQDTAKTTQIEEVVVTGAMGIKRKVDALTSTQQVVSSKELNQAGAPNAVQALTGKVSGLQISNTNSGVDGTFRIVLRGNKSLTGSNTALIVIDNAISDSSVLQALAPEAIESVNVLKGPQGGALYGAQGVNGVIIVTTKRGPKSEKVQFNLTSAVEINEAFKFPYVQKIYGKGVQDTSYNDIDYSGTNYVPWENTSWGPSYNDPSIGGQFVPGGLPQTNGSFIMERYSPVKDHFSKFFTNGINFQNGLTMSVGGSDSYAFLSLNRLDNGFVVDKDVLKQNNILFKGGKKLGKLRVDGQVNYISRIVNKTDSGLYEDIIQMPTMNDIRKYRNSEIPGYLTAYATNPYWTTEHTRYNTNRDYLNGILSLQYDFNKNINVTYTGNVSVNKTQQENYSDGFASAASTPYANTGVEFLDGHTLADFSASDLPSYYFNRTYNDRKYYGDLMLNFNYDLTDDLNLKLNLGNNIQDVYSTARTVGGNGLIIPGWYNFNNVGNPSLYADTATQTDGGGMDNYTNRSRVIAGFANLDLAFKDYLFLNATYRYEASSFYSSNLNKEYKNKPYPFPSVGLSFIPTKAFEFGGNVLTYMKIAPSYTRVGNNPLTNYQLNQVAQIPSGYPFGTIPSYIQSTGITDPNTEPEYQDTADLNVVLGFFNDRITIDGSIYQTTTDGLISNTTPSSASGLATFRTNIGKSRMRGFEINLGLVPIKTQDFNWRINPWIAKSRTELTELKDGSTRVPLLTYTTPAVGLAGVVGENFYSIVGTTYVKDPNGNIVVGANGVPLVNSTNSVLGSLNADYTLGLNTALRYKSLTLSATMDYRKGGKFVSFTKRLLAFTGGMEATADQDRTQGYVVPNSVQLVGGNYVPNTTAAYSDDYSGTVSYWTGGAYRNVGENLLVDATYFKVREISLSYDLPKALLSNTFLNGVSFSAYARNPIVIYAKSNRNYGDPETASVNTNAAGIALTTQYPTTRVFGFKLNATF